MTDNRSSQGTRVKKELEHLRSSSFVKQKRDKLKDLTQPLTTPEEAQAFLAAMRDKSHQREVMHKPPSNLSADGMEVWHLKQRQREKELRQRRREAEEILRGYRGAVDTSYSSGGGKDGSHHSSKNHKSPFDDFSCNDDSESFAAYDEHRRMSTVSSSSSFNGRSNQRDRRSHLDKEANIDALFDRTKSEDEIIQLAVTDDREDDEKKTDDKPNDGTDSRLEPTVWRDFITTDPEAKFSAEAGRYHLYLSFACPGSHRVLIVRALKGLEQVVSATFVHPTWRLTNPADPSDKHRGWVFGNPTGEPFTNTIGRGGPFPPAYPGNDPDPIFDAYSIREIYENAQDTSGKYTIPLLWDKKLNTIVNNESSDIAYMLNSCFNKFARNPQLDLYTEYDEDGVAKLNEVSEWLSPLMIHGVYRCGFAKTQRAYDKAIGELCEAFDRADDILQRQRYLTGDELTDADIRLFVTLIRFDEVYAFYFRANARLVMLSPSLLNFCRELYQMPGVAQTCDMQQVKAHFYGSHAEWNKYSVIPRGLGFMELLEMPHNRDVYFQSDNVDENIDAYEFTDI